jgi:acyl carrier protein
MTDEEIIAVINSTISTEFELPEKAMSPHAHLFEDLELDSLDIVDLVVVLEQAFKFKIREEQSIRKIRTLGDIHRFVISKKAEILHNKEAPLFEMKGISVESCGSLAK